MITEGKEQLSWKKGKDWSNKTYRPTDQEPELVSVGELTVKFFHTYKKHGLLVQMSPERCFLVNHSEHEPKLLLCPNNKQSPGVKCTMGQAPSTGDVSLVYQDPRELERT